MTAVKRHLFLTIWLTLIILVNLFNAYVTFLKPQVIQDAFPNIPHWVPMFLGAGSILNVIFALALFNWKKWGFWGFCVLAAAAAVVNIVFHLTSIPVALITPVISILLLYWALHVGKENKAWNHLT